MGGALGRRRHLPLRPPGHPRPGVLDRHPAADRQRIAARRTRLLVHPHRHHGPLQADARLRGLLPDGLGRQRAGYRAPGAELLRGALRPVPPLPGRVHAAGDGRSGQGAGGRGGVPTKLCRAVRATGRRGREGVRIGVAAVGPVGRLDPVLHDDRARISAGVATRVPADARPRRGLLGGGAHVVGCRLPDGGGPGRAGGPGTPGFLPPPGVPRAGRRGRARRHHPTGAAPRLRGPGRPPRRQPLLGRRHHGPHAGVRRSGAGARPSPGPAGQGHRDRHGLHLRRHDRRGLVARARPPGAGDRRPRRAAAGRRPARTGGAARPPCTSRSWPGGLSARPRPGSSSC